MLKGKKAIQKKLYHPRVKKLASFLERNGFGFDNGMANSKKAAKFHRIIHQYDNHKFSKENINPNWTS